MKKLNLTLNDFFELPTAIIYNAEKLNPVTSVSIDSRNVLKSSLFVAIQGDNLDGHKFVKQAIKNGSSVIIIDEKRFKEFSDLKIPFITVSDTTEALGRLAKVWRNKLRAKVIGITGSNGKTSTKEMLSELLSQKYIVNKTIANHNNHIGVPMTIFSTNQKHDILVAELGTNHFGEIKYTAEILQPDFALITNIGDSHLEFLKNRKGVLKEKSFLFNITEARGGTLIINNDDKLLKETGKKFKKKLSYSLSSSNSDVKGKIIGYAENGRPIITVEYNNRKMNFEIPLYGENNAKNFIASVTLAIKLGLSKAQISAGIKRMKPADKRLNVKKLRDSILIDDTYNANPESMKAAFCLMSKMSSYENKTAILGDMFELGESSAILHKKLASSIKENKIGSVYTIGSLMKNLNVSLKNKGIRVKHFNERNSLKEFLQLNDFENCVILVKGSRGMKMEEFVQILENRANN
ncbi:MAG: UDP-N-acetylmuramoyl-tripeptide--D-alanyl-D-alanine ligase [Ignavibacteriaceae bacterium]